MIDNNEQIKQLLARLDKMVEYQGYFFVQSLRFVKKNDSEIVPEDFQEIVNIIFPTIFLVILYNTFRTEIGNYFHGELVRTAVSILPPFAAENPSFLKDSSLEDFNWIWHINYTMFF